jgi:hypothetical protein
MNIKGRAIADVRYMATEAKESGCNLVGETRIVRAEHGRRNQQLLRHDTSISPPHQRRAAQSEDGAASGIANRTSNPLEAVRRIRWTRLVCSRHSCGSHETIRCSHTARLACRGKLDKRRRAIVCGLLALF